MAKACQFLRLDIGMCLKENYSDSPSNEYSRPYSAEYEYLRRQNMNSKSGEKQKKKKKGHHVRRSPKGQNDNGLILGRARVMPYYSDPTRHIPSWILLACYMYL